MASNNLEWLSPADEDGGRSRLSLYALPVICFVLAYALLASPAPKSSLPTINPPTSSWNFFSNKKSVSYVANAQKLIVGGFKKFTGPFNLVTDFGPTIMLPPSLIDAVNAEPKLDFNVYNKDIFLTDYDTFRSFRVHPDGMFEQAVMKGLTRSLPKFTKPLSMEMTSCLRDTWADPQEWRQVPLMDDVLKWVARLSTRIFLGEELVDNKDWLRISVDFTVNCFVGVTICKMIPSPFRYLGERLLPMCRQARRDYRASERILTPILNERHAEIARAEAEGRTPDLPDDAIEWFRKTSNGNSYNEVDIQLGLAVAAIHTTSDLLTQAVLNLCSYPEYVAPLREEAVRVLQTHGLQKVALTELRLLDSFFKETQRLKPIAMDSMHRTAIADVELPGGIQIKKGERIAISAHHMWESSEYPNPEVFDGFRFSELRKTAGLENKSQLVSTSHNHLAFAHGKHACPGRFFAANEVKIAMLHLLLKYDMRLKENEDVSWRLYGVSMLASSTARIMIRKRQPEVDLDTLAQEL